MVDLSRSDTKAVVAQLLRPYLTAKKDKTMMSQYERIAPDPMSGVVRTVLSPVVTETGRLASGESFVDNASTNLQNLSKKESYKDELYRVRDCFISRPGMSLLAFDFDKAEAVVMAFESDNWEFYDLLVSGEDVHRWVAANAYHGGNQKAVTTEERQRCKNVLYASLYMAGVRKITQTINADATSRADRLTEAEVQRVYDAIMSVLHLDIWWDRVWSELMDPSLYGGVRWLENALGFRRRFYNPVQHELHKEAVNFFPQSTVASRADTVMVQAFETLVKPGRCEFLLQVHDELIFEVADAAVPYYAKAIQALMEERFTARGREVFIPCGGAKAGKRWDTWRGPHEEKLDPSNHLQRMTSIQGDA
jgi:DNA polymerase I